MMKKRLALALLSLAFSGIYAAAQTVGTDAQGAIKLGNERYSRGEYEAAVREYGKVGRVDGEAYAQALYNTGVCYFEMQRVEDAVSLYRRAVEARDGRYPKALYALGVALEASGRLVEAKEAYRRAINVSNGKYREAGLAVAHYRLGLLTGREGDHEGAAALFREALARSAEKFPAAHNNLGVMLALTGRLTESRQEFEDALRQSNAGFEEAAYNLKLCRSLMAKEAMAMAVASLKVADPALAR